MAYEPTTEAGKKALADGADPIVVEEMEKSGELYEGEDKNKNDGEHIEKDPDDKNRNDKGSEEDQGGEGSEGDKDKDGEGEGDEGEGDKGQRPDRTPQSIPVWKHKEDLKKAREQMEAEFSTKLEKAVADAAAKAGGQKPSDATIKKVAEDFGLEESVASALIERMGGILEERLGLGDIRKNEAQRAERDREIAEQQGFEREFSDKKTQDALTAAAGGQQITTEVKSKVKELAYRSDYARYRLSDIIRLEAGNLFTAPARETRSAEGGRGGAARGASTPKKLEEMSPDDIESMSDEEFLKFSNELGGKGSRFTKVTKPRR